MLDNRFIKKSDPYATDIMGYQLPATWWSRPYEYVWALCFAREGETVVDAGCGLEHPFKWMLAKNGCKVIAIDNDERVLQCPEFPGVEYMWANLGKIPLPSGSVDKVFCISVMEHIPREERGRVYIELSRILKPDGLLILTMDMDGLPDPYTGAQIISSENFILDFDHLFHIEGDVVPLSGDEILHDQYGTKVVRLRLRKKQVNP